MDRLDNEIGRTQQERKNMESKLSIFMSLIIDIDIYGGNKFEFKGYTTSIAVNEDEDAYQDPLDSSKFARRVVSYTAPKSILHEIARTEEDDDSATRFRKSQRIIDREDDYRRRRLQRKLSPDQIEAFALGDEGKSSYVDVMKGEYVEEERILREVAKKRKEGEEENVAKGPVKRSRNRMKRIQRILARRRRVFGICKIPHQWVIDGMLVLILRLNLADGMQLQVGGRNGGIAHQAQIALLFMCIPMFELPERHFSCVYCELNFGSSTSSYNQLEFQMLVEKCSVVASGV